MKERIEKARDLLKEFQNEVKALQREGYYVTMDLPPYHIVGLGSGPYVTKFDFKLNVSKTETF